jgi:hypothetical protein
MGTDVQNLVLLGTLADETGRANAWSVKRALVKAGYPVVKVSVDGELRNAVARADADAWKVSLNTPGVERAPRPSPS